MMITEMECHYTDEIFVSLAASEFAMLSTSGAAKWWKFFIKKDIFISSFVIVINNIASSP